MLRSTIGDPFYQIVSLLFLSLAVYDALRSLRASWVSGFKFYLGSILLLDLPLVCIALAIVTSEIDSTVVLLPLLFSPVSDYWIVKRQDRAQQSHPVKWKAWEDKLSRAKRVDKVLFSRVVHRLARPTSPQETAQPEPASVKIFKITASTLLVVALIGLALIAIILLSRRG